jgi:hypothetical protein
MLNRIFIDKKCNLTGLLLLSHFNQSWKEADQVKAKEVGWACGMHEREKESVQGFGGKAQMKETTWKTETYMGRWDQNGL